MNDTALDIPAEEQDSVIVERFLRHARLAESTSGRQQVWHIAVARGLYRFMVDRELAGGPQSPLMGCPHILCLSNEEMRCMVEAVVEAEKRSRVITP